MVFNGMKRTSLIFKTMFLSNLLQLGRWKSLQIVSFSTSRLSRTISNERHDGNDWLLAYLRDRKTFDQLNEEQRRRVIDIGARGKKNPVNKERNTFDFSFILELQTLRESGERVPETIPDERWSELINISSFDSRKVLYG